MVRVVEVEHTDVNQAATTRPAVQGTRGIVTSGHSLTTMAAVRMLLSGGNAFDAAVAAGFAAAVLEPTASYTIAAEGVGMVYHAATGEMLALSGQGVAPRAQTVAYFRGLGLDRIPTGPGDRAHLSFTVPGVVDAYLLLLSRYGSKPVREVLEPAIDYAEHGFPMYDYMHRLLGIAGAREQFDTLSARRYRGVLSRWCGAAGRPPVGTTSTWPYAACPGGCRASGQRDAPRRDRGCSPRVL